MSKIEKNNNKMVSDSVSSVNLKQTTRGTNVDVKVYNDNPFEAMDKAIEIFEKLREKYPND